MTTGVKIDFKNIYKQDSISDNLRLIEFTSSLRDGTALTLRVEISNEPHELLPFAYNLAFGPLDSKGRINDKAEIKHRDYSKVFSTILFNAFTYLNNNPEHFLGVDGSDNNRAYLYYRFMQRNFEYLSKYFNMYGIKYFVRISRFGKTQYDNPFCFGDIKAVAVELERGKVLSSDEMYNYFIFNVKHNLDQNNMIF
jgi:hypothetical protein